MVVCNDIIILVGFLSFGIIDPDKFLPALDPEDWKDATYYVCCVLFWSIQDIRGQFFHEAFRHYFDLISLYPNRIRKSMNILVQRILKSNFYKKVPISVVPSSFRDIYYPSFDFSLRIPRF